MEVPCTYARASVQASIDLSELISSLPSRPMDSFACECFMKTRNRSLQLLYDSSGTYVCHCVQNKVTASSKDVFRDDVQKI